MNCFITIVVIVICATLGSRFGAGGGLFGAFIGIFISSFLIKIMDKLDSRKEQAAWSDYSNGRTSYNHDPAMFEEHMLILIAYVAKADRNRLLQSEFNYCKQYFQENFPKRDISELMIHFREILDDPNNGNACQRACVDFRKYATVHEKIALLQGLFGFATADGQAHPDEINAIKQISVWCGIDDLTYEAVKLMCLNNSYTYSGSYRQRGGQSTYGGYGGGYKDYYDYGGDTFEPRTGPTLNECYQILEISPDATDEEVKKAYREAAKKHHPDKVSHLGESVRKKAEENFAKVNQAYDKIKAARGMK